MTKPLLRHISMVLLLIFVSAVVGRVCVAVNGCHCTQVQCHHCCGCEEHMDDCCSHTYSIEQSCAFHNIDLDSSLVVSSDSKPTVPNRYILLCYLQQYANLIISDEEPVSYSQIFYVEQRYLDWFTAVGLIRAPSMC